MPLTYFYNYLHLYSSVAYSFLYKYFKILDLKNVMNLSLKIMMKV
jgi:hypothetical protein